MKKSFIFLHKKIGNAEINHRYVTDASNLIRLFSVCVDVNEKDILPKHFIELLK